MRVKFKQEIGAHPSLSSKSPPTWPSDKLIFFPGDKFSLLAAPKLSLLFLPEGDSWRHSNLLGSIPLSQIGNEESRGVP